MVEDAAEDRSDDRAAEDKAYRFAPLKSDHGNFIAVDADLTVDVEVRCEPPDVASLVFLGCGGVPRPGWHDDTGDNAFLDALFNEFLHVITDCFLDLLNVRPAENILAFL